MGRSFGSKGTCIYTRNNYLIDMLRLKKELKKNSGVSASKISRELGINLTTISTVFNAIKDADGYRTIDIDDTCMYKSIKDKSAGLYKLSPIINETINKMIDECYDNNYIKENLELRLRRDGYKMQNNKAVKTEVIEGVQNISIDLGNFSIKCCGERETIITSKVKTVYDNVCDNEYIKFEDSDTYDLIGCEDGKYQLDPQKTKKNYISQVIYSIINSYNKAPDDIECNVALLLPITQMNDKDEYIEKLKDYECIVEVTGGKVYTVKINEVVVLPESVASYFTLTDEEKKNKLGIVDVGSKNVNICSYLHGKLQKVECLEYGTFKYLESLAKKYNANGNVDITAHNITTQIECGLVEHDETLIASFAKTIMADIIAKMDSFKLYNNVLFTGGGSKLIEDFINIIPNAIKNKDVVMSNTIGAKNMMDEIYSA